MKENRVVFTMPWNGADWPKLHTILDEIEQLLLPLGSR